MWKERFLTLLRFNPIALIFATLGLVLIIIGIASAFLSENENKGVIIEKAASDEQSSLVVDVAGAVLKPGVYKLSASARLQEALIAAGGLASDADREYLSKNLNLAAKLMDGAKIYVPSIGESTTGITSNTGIKGSAGTVAGVVSGLININTASQSELEDLPGIGPVTAGKIIDNRPYGSVDELLSRKIVGQKVFGQIKDKLSVY